MGITPDHSVLCLAFISKYWLILEHTLVHSYTRRNTCAWNSMTHAPQRHQWLKPHCWFPAQREGDLERLRAGERERDKLRLGEALREHATREGLISSWQ